MKSKLFYLALAGALLPAAAQAGDFSGFHIAALAGWDDVGYENDDFGVNRNFDDIAYGLATGYDFKVSSNVIIGAGTSMMLSGNKETFVDGIDQLDVKAKRDFEIGGRIGVILNPTIMVYAKAAYANARFKAALTTDDITTEIAHNEDGYRVGVGIEAAVFDPMFLTLEYRYTDYGQGLSRNQVLGGIGARF